MFFSSQFIHTKQQVQSSQILKISKNFKSFLKFSFLNLVKMPKKKATSNKDVYEKAEDLPEGRKKLYDSILEDFDKQGKNGSIINSNQNFNHIRIIGQLLTTSSFFVIKS